MFREMKRKGSGLPAWLTGATELEDEEAMDASVPSAPKSGGVDSEAVSRALERLGPARDPRTMFRDMKTMSREMKTMLRYINDPAVVGAPQDAAERFAHRFLGTTVDVAWPPMHAVTVVTRAVVNGLGIYPETVLSDLRDLDWSWHAVIGMLRALPGGMQGSPQYPVFRMEVVLLLASDLHLYGYDAGHFGDGSVFRLCDNAAAIFEAGALKMRSVFYNFPYEPSFERIAFDLMGDDPRIISLLSGCQRGVGGAVYDAYCAAGCMKRPPYGRRVIVFTNQDHCPDLLRYLPQAFIDKSLRPAGFIFVAACYFNGGRGVLLHTQMSGVFHLLKDDKVVCMAENLRAYVRRMCGDVTEEEVPGAHYHPSCAVRCDLGRRYRLPPSVPYKLPDRQLIQTALQIGPLTEEQTRDVTRRVYDEFARCGVTPGRAAVPRLGAGPFPSPR